MRRTIVLLTASAALTTFLGGCDTNPGGPGVEPGAVPTQSNSPDAKKKGAPAASQPIPINQVE